MPENGRAPKSWRAIRVTSLLGIDYPIIQAPFGGLPSQRLTATVSNLGCLGSLGALTLGKSAIQEAIGEIRSVTTKPFAVNFWVSTSDRNAATIPKETIEERLRSYAATGVGVDLALDRFRASAFVSVAMSASVCAGCPLSRSFCDSIDISRLINTRRLKNRVPPNRRTDRREAVCREWNGLPSSLRCLFLLNRGRGFSDHI